MQAVEGFSHGYVEGNAWRTPLSWAGKDKWIVVAYLKGICKVSANEVTSTLSVAFGVAVVEHGGGVAYEPTKNDLEHYFCPLARAKDSKGSGGYFNAKMRGSRRTAKSDRGVVVAPVAMGPAAQPRRIPSIQPSAANQGPGTGRVLGRMVGKVYTPNANQERFFSKHRANIRNQHPRNTCNHQRSPSFFSMIPRVYKPQKNGRQLGFNC